MIMSGYDFLKSQVLSCWWKVESVCDDVISSGRVFQTQGPATMNARSWRLLNVWQLPVHDAGSQFWQKSGACSCYRNYWSDGHECTHPGWLMGRTDTTSVADRPCVVTTNHGFSLSLSRLTSCLGIIRLIYNPVTNPRLPVFYARQHICYSAYMPRQSRLSVHLSHACIVSKRLNVSSKFFHHLIGPSF